MHSVEAVFFDLDGTLIDTAPDMGGALNRLLERHQLPTLPMGTMRPFVSDGANALIKLGFMTPLSDKALLELRAEYLEIYREHLAEGSRLFDGMATTLDTIEDRRLPWGIVTNKPGWLAEPLLEQLGLRHRCSCAVNADTCTRRKPHPMPMYHACELTRVAPQHCIYVGDSPQDIEAGNAAGMTTIVARYGYISVGESTTRWRADGYIDHPEALIDWLPPHRLKGTPSNER